MRPVLAFWALLGSILLAILFIWISNTIKAPEDESGEVGGSIRTFVLQSYPVPSLAPHAHTLAIDSMEDTGHHVRLLSDPIVPEEDLWVTGVSFEVINAPAFTLHHGTVFRTDERDLECPLQGPRPLLSVAQDQAHGSEVAFAEGYAIFVPKGTPLVLESMFHNPLPPLGIGETYTDVSLKVTFSLADTGQEALKPLTYHLLRLSDDPCGANMHTFAVPARTEGYIKSGSTGQTDGSAFIAQATSTIVYWGAHMHGWEGGRSVTVSKNEKEIQVFPTQRSQDDPYRFDTPHGPAQVQLQAGDKISIESLYDNWADVPLRGAMGHLAFYIAEDQ